MFKVTLAVLIVTVLAKPAVAQLRTCVATWQTTDPDGKADAAGARGMECTAVRNQPAGDCPVGASSPTGDAVCIFSISQWGYRCCYTIKDATFATPPAGQTFAALGPGTTPTPQNLKPRCPKGALAASTVSNSNQIVTCGNITTNNCPAGYVCTKAANVVDVYGTPNDPRDDLGAAKTPYLCCNDYHLRYPTAVFTDALLSPAIVPYSPTAGIDFVTLSNPAKTQISLSDDFSYLPEALKTAPTSLTLYKATISGRQYHVLLFDSSNNKYCMFFGNIAGDGKKVITLPTISATNGAGVYNSGTDTVPVYKFTAAYQPPVYSSVVHRFVVVVFETTTALTFTAAKVSSTTQINNKAGQYGDFEPSRVTGNAGVFTDVATMLKSNKFRTLLKTPIAGTYFFLKN